MSKISFIKAFALLLSLNTCCLFFYIGGHLLEIEKSFWRTLLKAVSNVKAKIWVLFTLFLMGNYFYLLYGFSYE
jgi:hypothetical protein